MRNISIVIPNWNGLELIKESFDSFVNTCKHFEGKSEIIVVDNGSNDRSVDVIRDFYPEINVITLDKNYGFGYACNVGVKSAQFENILLLNNDLTVPNNFLTILEKTFDRHPNAFSVSPHTNFWTNNIKTDKTFSSSIAFDYLHTGELVQCWAVNEYKPLCSGDTPTAYGTGAALLIDKNKFLKLGGFDELYGLAYWEDVDICLKAWRNGWPSIATDKTLAWHKISATSTKQENKKEFKERLMTLNYILFMLTVGSDIQDKWRFLKKYFLYMESQKNAHPETFAFIQEGIRKNIWKIIKSNLYYTFCFWKSLKQMKSSTEIKENGWRSQPILEI